MPDLTTTDLAAHYQVHVQTIQQALRDERFPGQYRIGKTWRVPEESRDALRTPAVTGLAPRNNRSRAQQRNKR